MVKLRENYLLATAVFCFVVTLSSAALVSTIECPNGNECVGIDHSTCDTTQTPAKCKCGAAYKDGTDNAEGTCVAKALGDPCTAGADAECAGVTNATCKATDNVCACPVQYKAVSGACILRALSEACAAGVNAECGGVANAECQATTNVCACPVQYKTGTNTCTLRGLNETCTKKEECSGIPNAECVGTPMVCTCETAYTAENGRCNSANGLQTLLSAPVALLLSFLTIVVTRLH